MADRLHIYFDSQIDPLKALILSHDGISSEDEILRDLSPEDLINQFSEEKIFGRNLIRKLYFGGRQGFVPRDVVDRYRDMINLAPAGIKAEFIHIFQKRIEDFNWLEGLTQFLSESLAYNGPWSLCDIEDFSIGAGVYCMTFLLEEKHTTVELFLKREFEDGFALRHESFYHEIQAFFLNKGFEHPLPFYYDNNQGPSLSISLKFPGLSAELFFREWLKVEENRVSPRLRTALLSSLAAHTALGDLFGRNDRHLGNTHIACSPLDESFSNDIVESFESAQTLWMIDFDLQYLLKSDNYDWICEDIRQGMSEWNILRLCIKNFLCRPDLDEIFSLLKHMNTRYRNTLDLLNVPLNQTFLKEKLTYYYGEVKANETLELLYEQWAEIIQDRWMDKHHRAFLLDYRYRCVLKESLSLEYLKGGDLGPLAIYGKRLPLEGVASYLEAFRGVSSKPFAKKHGHEGRLSFEELEEEVSKRVLQERWEEIQESKRLFEEETETVLARLKRS
jgi:hypothetical protein